MNKIIYFIILNLFCCSELYPQNPYENYNYVHPYNNDFSNKNYKERRDKLIARLPEKSIAIIFSSEYYNYANSAYSEQLQNSNLFYLTGLPHQKAIVILLHDGCTINGKFTKEIIFLEKQSANDKMWAGAKASTKDAETIFNFSMSIELDKFNETIDQLPKSIEKLIIAEYPKLGMSDDDLQNLVYKCNPYIEKLKSKYQQIETTYHVPELKELREIKDSTEIRMMRKAIEITCLSHIETLKASKPGMTVLDLRATMEYMFKRLGAESLAYPSIINAGAKSCLLHTHSINDTVHAGELVLMDCGAEYHSYCADITRTFPISGKFSREQLIIYKIVLEAQDSAISVCKPGASFKASNQKAIEIIQKRLVDIGLAKSEQDALVFFPHGTSHHLGLDVHDAGISENLKSGNVITVEPGIYIPEGSNCDKKWWNIGIRIEDDVLITDSGNEVLSMLLPRKPEEIENLLKK